MRIGRITSLCSKKKKKTRSIAAIAKLEGVSVAQHRSVPATTAGMKETVKVFIDGVGCRVALNVAFGAFIRAFCMDRIRLLCLQNKTTRKTTHGAKQNDTRDFSPPHTLRFARFLHRRSKRAHERCRAG